MIFFQITVDKFAKGPSKGGAQFTATILFDKNKLYFFLYLN